MPVQLNLLVQEAEENCITEHFTRECIEVCRNARPAVLAHTCTRNLGPLSRFLTI